MSNFNDYVDMRSFLLVNMKLNYLLFKEVWVLVYR